MLKNYNLLLIREEVVETHNGNAMHTKIELKLPEKQNEGQSAVELLSTYAWAFIIVSILVVTVGIYIGIGTGARYIPSQCNIQPLLPCPQTALAQTANQISYKMLIINNLAPYMYFPSNSFIVSSAGINPPLQQNYTGACAPSIAGKGDEIICTVYLPSTNAPPVGSSVNMQFSLKYQICSSSAISTCESSQYSSTGTSFQPLSSSTSNLYKLNLVSDPNSTIIINGQRYISKTSMSFIYLPFGSYTAYALVPSGYSFGGWSGTPTPTNITLSSSSSQNITIRLTGNSTLTAMFNVVSITRSSTTTIVPTLPTSVSSTSSTTTVTTTTSTSTTSTTSTSTVTTTSTSATTTIPYGYIFGVGSAIVSNSVVTAVYSSEISQGNVNGWLTQTRLPMNISTTGCSIYSNFIYCVGSEGTRLNLTYSAPITGGTVGTWTAQTAYPIGLEQAGCSIYQGYIYCVGSGVGPSNRTYSAPVSSGTIGSWTRQVDYPTGIYGAGCSIYNGYIYCIGNAKNATTLTEEYSAAVSAGTIGPWVAQRSYPVDMAFAGCSIYNGYIYCVGTSYYPNQKAVYSAQVSSGTIGPWTLQPNLYPAEMYNGGCAIFSGYIYCVGGAGANQSVYSATVNNGAVGTWIAQKPYPVPIPSYSEDAWVEISGYGSGGGGFDGGGGPSINLP